MSHIPIRILPNASITEIVGHEGGIWKIRIAAPAVEGRANRALIQFLADACDVAPSTINILKGQVSKVKTIEIPLSVAEIEECLEKASGH
jgi:uncharacterized protein (TIGR00251 family)